MNRTTNRIASMIFAKVDALLADGFLMGNAIETAKRSVRAKARCTAGQWRVAVATFTDML